MEAPEMTSAETSAAEAASAKAASAHTSPASETIGPRCPAAAVTESAEVSTHAAKHIRSIESAGVMPPRIHAQRSVRIEVSIQVRRPV